MSEIDHTVCPKCGNDDTTLDQEWVYEFGYTDRICEDCKTKYKVYWNLTETRKIILEEEQ